MVNKTDYERLSETSKFAYAKILDNISNLCSEISIDCVNEIVESDKNEHEIQAKSDN